MSPETIWAALAARQCLIVRDTWSRWCNAQPLRTTPDMERVCRNLEPPLSRTYQYDTLNSAFRPLAACCRAAESSAEPDNPRIRGRSAGFQRSNRQPLLGILKFQVAWTIFVPQMQRNRTIRAHGMITELCVGN